MSRLIDADKTIKNLIPILQEYVEHPYVQGLIIGRILTQPTAYDVEKVVEELEVQAEKYRNIAFEYEKEGLSTKADKYYHRQLGFLHSIGVVRKGGVE